MTINADSKTCEKFDKLFWRNVRVPIDMILEYRDSEVIFKFNAILEFLSLYELSELAVLYGFILQEEEKKAEVISLLKSLEIEKKREVLILREFLSRKKRTVLNYYRNSYPTADNIFEYSQIAQLGQLLEDKLSHIAEIFTWFTWDNKGSGQMFSITSKVTYEKAIKIPTEYAKHFSDFLHKESKQEHDYKVFSYATESDNRILVRIHRMVNDASRFDFDEPFRNKEVAPILFVIDLKESVLEIRTKFKKEIYWIKSYVEETFGTVLTDISPDIFTDYLPSEIKSAFLEGRPASGSEVFDFMVNKIVFRSSPLRNYPRVTFQLENSDVIPSIKDAHARECIDLNSIKDIESLSIKSTKVSSRTIKSNVLEDGNVIFSIEDSGLDGEVKKEISQKFFEKFGIPLDRRISNAKFTEGKADIIDYLMGLSNKLKLTEFEEDLYTDLINDGFLKEIQGLNYFCKNPNCDYSEDHIDGIEIPIECPSCNEKNVSREEYTTIQMQVAELKKFLKDCLIKFCGDTDWEYNSFSERTVFDKKYKFHILNNLKGETIQVLLYDGHLSQRFVNKINSFLTPTLVVCPGIQEKYLHKFNIDCVIPITVGKLISVDDKTELFNDIYQSFQHRTKHYIASIAYKSFENLNKLPSATEISKKYTPSDFEDDVFNLLIDIFPNAEKWGSRLSGKEVPEGIFTVNYIETEGDESPEYRYVFSFDCKLNNTLDGYDLSKDEQRKAFDYAELLNKNSFIAKYSNKKQVSSHIFICNNFKESNFGVMADYFYRKQAEQGSKYTTRPIFLTINTLTYLHSLYRKNINSLRNARNIFYKEIYHIFTTDKYVITNEMIDNVFEMALEQDLADYKDLDTKKVKREIIKKLKKRND